MGWGENGQNVVGVWFLLSSKSPAKAKYCAISRVSKSRITCGGWQPPSKPVMGKNDERIHVPDTRYSTPAAKTLPLIRLGGRCALTFFSKKAIVDPQNLGKQFFRENQGETKTSRDATWNQKVGRWRHANEKVNR